MKWECPSLGDAGSSPAKFSSFLKFLLVTLKLSFFLLSVKYYSVTLSLKSDAGCMLSSLHPQPKHKTPKADSRLHAMKKQEKAALQASLEVSQRTRFVFVQYISCAFQT